MLQELLAEKQAKIDRRAKRDKAAVCYISSLLEQSWDEFKRVFDPEGEISADELPEKLFVGVQKTIEEIQEEYCRVIGIRLYYFPGNHEPIHPAAQLGWAEFRMFTPPKIIQKMKEKGEFPERPAHSLRPTQLGVDVVNGYRSAQDYVSLEEQRKINAEQTSSLFKRE
jgi:hypothetical protein